MKLPFNFRLPSFDANAIHETIQRALASAGLNPAAGSMHDMTETMKRILAAGRGAKVGPWFDTQSVVDGHAHVVPVVEEGGVMPPLKPWVDEGPQRGGTFESHQFSNHAGSRAYKVYVPTRVPQRPCAMIVMLHGCTQSADDFAAGTQMNHLAQEHGFLVVYPEQTAQANPSKCWNWFKPTDQLRDAGEPALIAGLVREVAQRHGVDARRIFVAGLSAGAAMAVVLGETYPELFASVGAHSGLPYGSAHDIPSALGAMKGGRSGLPGLKCVPKGPPKKAVQAVPLIVFHGDRDHTVQKSNAEHIVRQAQEAHAGQTSDVGLVVSMHSGVAAGGAHFSRAIYTDSQGQVHIESWTLHGAGHAWSGGDARGSYTSKSGPNASAEMVRFFMALPRAGSA